jgi:uncharacterized membrane protein YedE/YeeE
MIGFICGLLFGCGLVISGMVDPAKVIGFLDVTGSWDPSLAFVMVGALSIFAPVYWLVIRRRSAPLFANAFSLPTRRDIDGPLVVGAALFGMGWGLVGFCPGPALVALASGQLSIFAFVASMITTGVFVGWLQRRRASAFSARSDG